MYLSADPSPPTSTSCPPDVIHVIGVPRPSPFFMLFCFCVLYWTQTEEKNGGGLGMRLTKASNSPKFSPSKVSRYVVLYKLFTIKTFRVGETGREKTNKIQRKTFPHSSLHKIQEDPSLHTYLSIRGRKEKRGGFTPRPRLYTHPDWEDSSNVHLVGCGFPDTFLQTLLTVKGLVADVDIIC